MSSSFFIRNNNRKGSNNLKRKAGKPKVHYAKKDKKSTPKPVTHVDDEEISSDDEDINLKDQGHESEEEVITAQEKKLQLAKKYLEEIEKEEKGKLDEDEEVDNDVILGRLKEDVLTQAGKFKRKVASEIRSEISQLNIKVLRCKEHKLSITCVTVTHDGQFVFSGSKDGSVVKWTINGVKVKCLPPQYKNKSNENLHSSSILALAISYDNKYLAASDEGTLIQIWNVGTLDHVYYFKGHRAAVTGLSFCRITHNLFSCSKDKTVKVWSMSEKAYIETLFGHHDPITGVDVLCKGKAVTSGGIDNSCRVWKIDEETQLIYNGNCRSIDSVKRLDDQHFISSSDDGSICLWGMLKKKPLVTLKSAHNLDPRTNEPYWISSIGCISNSEVFASGSNDGFIRLWTCTNNYREITEFSSIPIKGFINSIVFSSDNKYLILGVGQEHKLGRWETLKEAKNCVIIINLTEENKGNHIQIEETED